MFLGVNVLQLLVQETLPALNTFLLLGSGGLTLLLSVILVPFFLFHTWLLVRNMTTIEFVEKLRAYREEGGAEFSTESAYDLGVFENVRSVLGESPLFWLLPVGGPMGDGLRFDTRPEEALESASEEEADPEEAHPAGAEEVASSAGSSATASGDCASFLVWHSAADFVDDVRVGCETIEEAYEGTLAQFAACLGRRPKGKARSLLGVKLSSPPRPRRSRWEEARSPPSSASGADFLSSD
mmetsp:Transcript_111010/g.308623  ORF Transcript_111010/g.308623 Transcript_111010/m.308623 type:complete len:240 (-) Transcript_111010:306-1025(-)